jgi:hypothetical protein
MVSSSPHDIASSVALTRDLFMMQSLSAVNAVLAAVDRTAVAALDLPSLFEFGYDAIEAAGCDVSFFKAFNSRKNDLKNCILVRFLLYSSCAHVL